MDSRGLFRKPFAARSAAPGSLFFGKHDGAVGLSLFAELHGDGVRRVDFEEVIDAAREGSAKQPPGQELGNENVRSAFDVIAGPRMTFYAHTQFAHFLDPAPDLLPRYADFLGNLFPADDDCGILGQ